MKKAQKHRPHVHHTKPDDVKRADFVWALAEYFCKDQAKMSILLEMGNDHARYWAKLRGLTPLMGYPTVEEAARILSEFLR